MALNKSLEDVPAQRIVNRIGMLSVKIDFSPIKLMQQFLENEGIILENIQIIDFENSFWHPQKELN